MRLFLSLYPLSSFQFPVVENSKQHDPEFQGELLLEEDESISGQWYFLSLGFPSIESLPVYYGEETTH